MKMFIYIRFHTAAMHRRSFVNWKLLRVFRTLSKPLQGTKTLYWSPITFSKLNLLLRAMTLLAIRTHFRPSPEGENAQNLEIHSPIKYQSLQVFHVVQYLTSEIFSPKRCIANEHLAGQTSYTSVFITTWILPLKNQPPQCLSHGSHIQKMFSRYFSLLRSV